MNRLFPEEQADLGPHVLLQKHKGDAADDIYPFMPNGISNCYQLDPSISIFWVVGWYFFIQILEDTSASKQWRT